MKITIKINVLATVNDNPQINSRQIERESDINKRSILILTKHKYHPYRIDLHQDFHGTDFENRVTSFVSGCSIKCTLTMNFCH